MFKKLIPLLLSIFVLPGAVTSAAALSNEQNMVLAEEPEVLHGYTYTDEYVGENNELYRRFDYTDFCPTLTRNFYAPSGYIFTLDLDEEKAGEIIDQMVFLGSDLSWIEITFAYKLSGSRVAVQRSKMPSFAPGTPVEEIKPYLVQLFTNIITGYELFKVEKALSEITIAPQMDFKILRSDYSPAHVVLEGDPIYTKPFDTKDLIKVSINYTKTSVNSGNAAIFATTIDGFFNEYPSFNKYGWNCDYKWGPEGEERAFFTYSLYAYEDVPLALDLNTATGFLEMSYPDEEIPIKAVITFTSNGEQYSFESDTAIFADPNASVLIDSYVNKTAIQKETEHDFSVYFYGLDLVNISAVKLDATAVPYRLNDAKHGHDLYETSGLPETGIIGDYYYVPSTHEKELYNAGRIEELNALQFEGTYYYYDGEFKEYAGVNVFDVDYNEKTDERMDVPAELLTSTVSFSYAGRWDLYVDEATVTSASSTYSIKRYSQTLTTFADDKTQDSISFNIPDKTNLILGAGDVEVIPTITTASGLTDEYFFDFEVSRNGIVNVIQDVDDKFIIEPVHTGLITLTVGVECSLFPRMEKQISIRVLDAIYDASKIEIADEFHKAGQNIDMALNIRGFTSFQNLDVEWVITNKKGEALPASKIDNHKDATITFLNPGSDDYTIKASHEGVELDKVTIQVRYVDLNSFLKAHVWWMVLITLGFAALVVLLMTLTKKGKTTVNHIERVYQVYCQCMSNNTLSKEELNKIKKEITKCLHRCEDLNIDAFNQYEKATRYLRKSLVDTKILARDYDKLSEEEKNVMYVQLDKDLSKALNVAKEIEEAKQLIEQYHDKANRQNYEVVKEEKPDKKAKK